MKAIKMIALLLINGSFGAMDNNADFKLADKLCDAAEKGDIKTLQQYQDVLQEKNIRNKKRDTPLLCACYGGQIETYKFLKGCKKKWTDQELRGDFNATRLHYATQGNKLAMVKYLVEIEECDVDVTNNQQSTALHIASLYRYYKIIDYLLSKHALDTIPNKKGYRPSDFLKAWGILHIEELKRYMQ